MAEKLETKSKLYPTYYKYPIPFNPEEGMDVFSPTDEAPEVEDVDKDFKVLNCYNNNISIMKSGVEYPYTEQHLIELKKCKDDILYFIVNYCKIVTLKHGVQKFKLFQYQKNAIKVMHENRFSIFKFPRQMGKALWEETLILTPNGFKPLKEINIGDFVFDESGKAVKVVNKTEEQLNRDCYKVTFSNGEIIIADGEHDWKYYDKCKEKEVITNTVIMKERLEKNLRIEQNLRIDLSDQLEFDYKSVPIDPYALGVWIGDGFSHQNGINSEYRDYCEYKKYIPLTECKFLKNNNKVVTYKFDSFTTLDLKNNNLYKNKHIPKDYIFNTKEIRINLLKGLMDTDGSIEENGVCRFHQSNIELINDFVLLLSTLGIKGTISKKIPKKGKIAYTVCFVCNDFDVSNLPRKLERQYANKSHPKNKRVYIKSIEKVDSVPVYCIQVDNESHMFLAGRTLIPTHNCVIGDTNVTVKINGEELELTIGQLYDLIETDNKVESYTPNEDYQILTEDGFKDFDGITSRYTDILLMITTEDGNQIKVTPQHEVKLFNGEFIKASDLKIGDSLGIKTPTIIKDIIELNGNFKVADMISVKDTRSFAVNDMSAILSNCIDGNSMITLQDNHTGEIFDIHISELYDYLLKGSKQDL